MNERTTIIQAVIDRIGATSYLEIGVRNPAHNFNRIKCAHKVGVDPAAIFHDQVLRCTSDDYFSVVEDCPQVVFIDGDHSHRQSAADLKNAFEAGARVAVMHDALPSRPEWGGPKPIGNGPWCGEVWKTVQAASYMRITFPVDYGVSVLINKYRTPKRTQPVPPWSMPAKQKETAYGIKAFTNLENELSAFLGGISC